MSTKTHDLVVKPLPLQSSTISYGGVDLRYMLGAMYNRTGRIGPGDSLTLLPRSIGADWSIDVQAGQAIIAGQAGSGAFAPERYLVTLPARTNIRLDDAVPPFVLAPTAPRNHGVYVVVDDANYTGSAYGGRIVIVEDVGSGPTPPTGFQLRLGTVTISPAQSNITAAHLSTTMQRASASTPITPVTYASGFATYVSGTIGQPLSYSLFGNTLRLQGHVYRTAGAMANATLYTVATLPVGYRPAYTRMMAGIGDGGATLRCQINVNGDIVITPLVYDITYASCDGVSCELF